MSGRRKYTSLLIVLLCMIFIPSAAAREILSDVDCVVEADEVINGSLFVLCENLIVSGTVNGDLIGAALRAQIDGAINGNLYFVTGQLDLSANVQGDVHFGGLVLNIRHPDTGESTESGISGSLKAVALATSLAPTSSIGAGVLYLGYQLIADGRIEGEINFWGSALILNEQVRGDVYAAVGNPASDSSQLETLLLPLQFDIDLRNPGLTIGQDAQIRGHLRYSGTTEGEIAGRVRGGVEFDPVITPIPTLEEPGSFRIFLGQIAREYFTLMAVGVLGVLAMPRIARMPLAPLRSRPFPSFSAGLLAFILSFPIWLIVLFISLLLIVLLQITGLQELVLVTAIVLGMVNVGSASLFYFVSIFMARALIGLMLGRLLLRLVLSPQDLDTRRMLVLAQAVGLAVLAVAVSLPLLGWIVNAAALFLGLGAILLVTLEQGRRVRDSLPTPVPAWYAPSPIARAAQMQSSNPALDHVPVMPPLPPVPVNQQPPAPGTENLPEGFDWSFFSDEEP